MFWLELAERVCRTRCDGPIETLGVRSISPNKVPRLFAMMWHFGVCRAGGDGVGIRTGEVGGLKWISEWLSRCSSYSRYGCPRKDFGLFFRRGSGDP